MTDQTFRALCEKWIETYLAAIAAGRRYGALSAELVFTKLPLATESLDEVRAVQAQRDVLQTCCRAASEESRALAQEASRLDGQIRDILPAGVWYRPADHNLAGVTPKSCNQVATIRDLSIY